MKLGFYEYDGICYNRTPANVAARYYRMGFPVLLLWKGMPRIIQIDKDPRYWLDAVRQAYFRTTSEGVQFYPVHDSNIYRKNNI